ncbi:MAG: uncharacterized protein QOG63_673 [Thermoleophilaceae bacterium]|jgi:ketosteroid isomerase-like protein|nr:uncharacterized protein [Thermoleophilaceae bacterium]
MDNTSTVRDIYEAFGRGDVETIASKLADDVAWESWEDNHAQRAGVPQLEPRRGRDAALEFFALAGAMEIREFAVRDVLGSERQVAADVLFDAQLPGGGRLRDEELHLWTFDDEGRVTRMRHYVDTAKHIAATR